MRHLKSAGLAVATLCICLSPSVSIAFSPLPVFAQTQTANQNKLVNEAMKLIQEGLDLAGKFQYQAALKVCHQGLKLIEPLKPDSTDKLALEGLGFLCLGGTYSSLGSHNQALSFLQNALKSLRLMPTPIRSAEGVVLNRLGLVYSDLSKPLEALKSYEQSLQIRRQEKDRKGEGVTLNNMALVYTTLGQPQKALELLEQALAIRKEVNDRRGEGSTLNNMATAYEVLSQYEKALVALQQSLVIRREVNDRKGEGVTLSNIGRLYERLGRYDQALEVLNQALQIQQQIGAEDDQGTTLNGIAEVHQSQGQYAQALQFIQKSLAIFKGNGNREQEASALTGMADLHQLLGQYPKALELYLQALTISREAGHRKGEAISLSSAAELYAQQGQTAKAIEFFQQALAIRKEIGDRKGTATTLDKIGIILGRSQSAKAIEFFQRAFTIRREIGDRVGAMYSLTNLGSSYIDSNRFAEGIASLQTALAIARETNDLRAQALILSNLGSALKQQNQPELAITLLKQSVNTTEIIRRNLQGLPREQQESYTKTVAGTYRVLADLLIEQGRIGEAQQVLERLKLQEINDFTKGTRTAAVIPGIGFNTTETQIKTKHTSLIAFGSKFYDCEQRRCNQLTELRTQYNNLSKEFQDFVEQIKQQLKDQRIAVVDQATRDFQNGADRVVTAHPNSILIYPLVLSDKTRLLFASKGGVLSKAAVCPLGEKALYDKVAQFRTLISNVVTKHNSKRLAKNSIIALSNRWKANSLPIQSNISSSFLIVPPITSQWQRSMMATNIWCNAMPSPPSSLPDSPILAIVYPPSPNKFLSLG